MTKEELRQQFEQETGRCPIMDNWYDSKYGAWLEQRLLLSSEAEKGENKEIGKLKWWVDKQITIVKEKMPDADREFGIALSGKITGLTIVANYLKQHFSPSPPSPQEKQGVEEQNIEEWAKIVQRIKSCKPFDVAEMRGIRQAIEFLIPAPAAHDKGEEADGELKQAMSEMSARALEPFLKAEDGSKIFDSVGKSEGEEAERILKQKYFDHYRSTFPSDERTWEVVNMVLNTSETKTAILKAMQEYAHSSGDRGRKEGFSDVSPCKCGKNEWKDLGRGYIGCVHCSNMRIA